jgi:hypothetical protein
MGASNVWGKKTFSAFARFRLRCCCTAAAAESCYSFHKVISCRYCFPNRKPDLTLPTDRQHFSQSEIGVAENSSFAKGQVIEKLKYSF